MRKINEADESQHLKIPFLSGFHLTGMTKIISCKYFEEDPNSFGIRVLGTELRLLITAASRDVETI